MLVCLLDKLFLIRYSNGTMKTGIYQQTNTGDLVAFLGRYIRVAPSESGNVFIVDCSSLDRDEFPKGITENGLDLQYDYDVSEDVLVFKLPEQTGVRALVVRDLRRRVELIQRAALIKRADNMTGNGSAWVY